MYTEEPKRYIDWGSVIKKGLILLGIVLIIFLIIWLFARNNSNAINVNYDGESTNNNITNTDSYSEIFIDNYRYFHDTAKEYFLISELPENGKTLKYTLQELINKNLILQFGYGNETCDTEASYVSVKNVDGKYTMTTTLVCGKEVAKTTEELGCNQLCTNGTCNPKETIEYKYKQAYQATETTYSCPSGYTKTGSGENTLCTKGTVSTVAAKKETTYNCPSGYTKTGTGTNTLCTKGTSNVIDLTINYTYSCPSGYNKSGEGNNTLCTKTTQDKVNATYTCSDGYKLNGTKCIKTKDATVTYTCSNGTTPNSKNKCTVTNTTYVPAKSNISYSCPSGYTKSGSSCIKTIYSDISYGTSYQGCPGGQLVTSSCGSGCTKTQYVYRCSKGLNSITNYYCENGSTPNSNNQCKVTSTSTVNATAKYSCSSDYTLNGSTCTKTKNATPTCAKGTLSGDKCVITNKDSIAATKTENKSCPTGYKQDGNKCVSDGTATTNYIKNTTYTCEKGYTKNGLGSKATCTKGSTTNVKATKSTKKVTKYKYKWSSETSLSGWEKTGETRKVSSK